MEKFIRNITVVEDKARNIRINHGLTQKEFGEILGISKSMYLILKMDILD